MEGLSGAAVGAKEGETLRWVSHPWLRNRGRGVLTLVLIAATAAGLGLLMRSGFWGGFAALVLFFSLEGFYFRTRYEIAPEGVSVNRVFSKSRTEWGRFRRVYEDRHGLTLSPYRRRTILEPYRAARLLYDGGDPEAIRRAVRGFCPEAEWIAAGRKEDGERAERTGKPDSEKRSSG